MLVNNGRADSSSAIFAGAIVRSRSLFESCSGFEFRFETLRQFLFALPPRAI